MTAFNVTVFAGKAYTVEKRNVYRDETLSVPEGSVLLHAEVVQDSSDTELLEVWVAIPQDAVISTTDVKGPSPVMQLDVAEEVDIDLPDDEDLQMAPKQTFEEEDWDDGDEPDGDDDEYYADY